MITRWRAPHSLFVVLHLAVLQRVSIVARVLLDSRRVGTRGAGKLRDLTDRTIA